MQYPPDERSREPPDDAVLPRPKATLFCQRCGHESHVDGDWVERERAGRRHVHCPSCSHRITTRAGRDGTLPPAPDSGRTPQALRPLVDTWTGARSLWRASLRVWAGSLLTRGTDC